MAAHAQRALAQAHKAAPNLARRCLERLNANRPALWLAAALTAGYFTFAGLPLRWAIAGLLAVALWIALAADRSGSRAGARDLSAEERRSQGHLDWRGLLDALPEPVLMLDRSAHLLHANTLAAEIFERVRTGGHISETSRSPELIAAVERALAEHAQQAFELQVRLPIERRVHGLIAPLPMSGDVPGAPAMLVLLRDRTEQERLTQMRADFVANASHELRTPLAALAGFVETLQGPASTDQQARARFLAIMSEQARRMTRLVDDLLSLSRVEMREHVTPADLIDLNEPVAAAVTNLAAEAKAAGTQVRFAPCEGSSLVRGDRDELVQMAQNLVQNAIKYGKAGGKVEVALTQSPATALRPQRITLTVKDSGPGIAAQHLPRLTERFYRVSVASSREKGGTGLGLAIVKHIVNRHRGELAIASSPGQGSTFSVHLPAA